MSHTPALLPTDLPKDTPAVSSRGVSRKFGSLNALTNVTFDIPAGSICGLIGPNGAGKTTLLRILAGLDEPDVGTRAIDGVDLAVDPAGARNRFGYVPDYAGLYDSLTVRELVHFFGSAQGVPQAQLGGAVDRALNASGMMSVAERPAGALSKGMTQRACVATALVHDPQVLFLDEPASGLDPRARIELRELLKELRASGKTILISSHILSELGDMVDRVLILEKGVVRASGGVDAALQGVAKDVQLRLRIELAADAEKAETFLRSHARVATVTRVENALDVSLRPPETEQHAAVQAAEIIKILVNAGHPVSAVIPMRSNLESLFMTVTRGEVQ